MNRLKTYLSKIIAVVMIGIICAAAVSINATAAGATKISDKGLSLIKTFEGCRLTAYKATSSEEYYTIGWGHYGPDVKKGMTITQAQADKLLVDDMAQYENAVVKFANKYNRTFTQNQFDALVSFTYQNGCYSWSTHEKYEMHQYMAGLKSYDEGTLYRTFMAWSNDYTAGLVKRRLAECAIFLTPDSTPYELWEIDPNVNFRQSYTTNSTSYGFFRSYALVVVTEKKNNQGYTWGKTRYYMGNENSGSAKTGWVALKYANKRYGTLTPPATTAKPTTTTKKPTTTTTTTQKPTTTTVKPTTVTTTLDHDPIYPFEENENLGDVNDDGKVTAADVLIMRKYIAGQDFGDYEVINSGNVKSSTSLNGGTDTTLSEEQQPSVTAADMTDVSDVQNSGTLIGTTAQTAGVSESVTADTQISGEIDVTAVHSGSESGLVMNQAEESVLQSETEGESTTAADTSANVKSKVLILDRMDINNDKKTTAADVLMMRKHIAGNRVFY